ncbi:PHP domain-containing protein [Nocardioides gilvus]|uniref:PHP domain-containing protein n=1 Tax=Nocardioides gilvus TaxID=1735589 RepID=UPI000D741436|nr:PHP domain-containing protein [Nocardioides gilvus]
MRIDLHSHTHLSDGTQSPTELVHAAREAGLDVLALTDHDTFVGWDEAARAATQVGLTLVRGVEISTILDGHGVHLLAYLPDPGHEGIRTGLEAVLRARNDRLPTILERLAAVDVLITPEDVAEVAGDTVAVGRPHVADALVAAGVVAHRGEAFRRYLGPGGKAFVPRTAADLWEMVAQVEEAGGVSVLAHPWGRGAEQVLDAAAFRRLKEHGLTGIEVDHEDHGARERAELRAIAADLDLVVTGSSDHHGEGKIGHALGCNTTDPEQYARLIAAAESAALRAGRTTPAVIG